MEEHDLHGAGGTKRAITWASHTKTSGLTIEVVLMVGQMTLSLSQQTIKMFLDFPQTSQKGHAEEFTGHRICCYLVNEQN